MIIEDRVAAGASWLDRKLGPEWADNIDLAALDLSDGSYCVLGQLLKDYNYRMTLLGFEWGLGRPPTFGTAEYYNSEDFITLGFTVDFLRTASDIDDEFAALEVEWRYLIENRINKNNSGSVDPTIHSQEQQS